jgi:hypothetical protein
VQGTVPCDDKSFSVITRVDINHIAAGVCKSGSDCRVLALSIFANYKVFFSRMKLAH